jgi:hypothetical protein
MIFIGIVNITEDVEASGFRMDSRIKDAHASFLGEDADDWSGFSIAGAGDVNGDGYDDILITAPYDEEAATEAGQTYLILGKSSGWKMDVNLSSADASFLGENPDDRSGVSAAGAGDVNGDGLDDILIGAYRNDEGGSSAGQAYLIFGKASGWVKDMNLSLSDVSFWGENPQEQAGYSVAGAGDVNADGYDDILIGARYDSENGFESGEAYLVLGKSSGWTNDINLSTAVASFRGEDGSDVAGTTVAGAGDVNGDGFDDLLIGAKGDEEGGGSNCGQTYLIFGKSSGWAKDTDLSKADASFFGEDTFDYSSHSLDGAGDVNGDGFDDILIGAYADEEGGGINTGQTYLILGKSSGWDMNTNLNNSDASFWGEFINDNSGSSVAFVGDVNLDGYDDIMIGAYGNDEVPGDAGQAYLVLGKSSGWVMNTYLNNSDASFWAEDAGDHFGFGVAGAGDVNGDGYPDLLMSARYDEEGGNKAGQTYLVFYESAPTAPMNFDVSLSQEGTHLNLSWRDSEYYKKITGYIVYRSEDGLDYHELQVLNASSLSYTDWDVTMGQIYRYKVTAISSGPSESSPAGPIEILCDYDTDTDRIGNIVDLDDDGDGISDGADAFPLDANEWLDSDFDGIGNVADTDDDNDGIPDISDTYPFNPLNDLETYLHNQLDSLNLQHQTIDSAISSLSDLIGDDGGPSRAEILDRINDSIATMQNMEANTSSHDSDIKAALDSLVDLVSDEHDLTNAALLENLTDIINQLEDVQTNIQNDINEVDQSIESLDVSDEDTQDFSFILILLVMVLIVLLILGLVIQIQQNRVLRHIIVKGFQGEILGGEELPDEKTQEPEKDLSEEESKV